MKFKQIDVNLFVTTDMSVAMKTYIFYITHPVVLI
jgi:hypothetical protein